ncbi:CPBP family intramembrane glutamic endopeptidase [Haladaptatus paucihalophilus]|nr:type II CAAX endopeptidase family protein [Haladaptatus paucihalophilus]
MSEIPAHRPSDAVTDEHPLVRRLTNRYPVVSFIVLVYTISWSCWGLSTWTDMFILTTIGGFGPFIGGALLIKASGQNLRMWLSDIFRIRIAARYYLAALLIPILAIVLAGAAHVWLFGGRITPAAVPSVVVFPLYIGIILLFNGVAEEPGWRGFLLPRLQATHSALTASILVGIVWGVWHLPLLMLPGHSLTGINPWIYLPGLIALSVIMTWLTNDVEGSILPAMFFHASYNVSISYYLVGGSEGVTTSLTGGSLLLAIYGTLAVVLLVRYGPARLTPARPSIEDGSINDRTDHE